jgi:creatinine amidohydrolase/Fe(II)-dependent formamide hydrolase-like protein/7-cyano-7-deazaguanine synthase in queuosine biosynthesis
VKSRDALRVLDRIEVGPVHFDRRRLSMPIAVHRGREVARTDLVYKYEHDVFELGEVASACLARMVGVQAVLNYGLFCNEMRFIGPYDRADRTFIEQFARHTSREIFVNKLLMPNEFLTEALTGLSPVEDPARLTCRFDFTEEPGAPEAPWSVDASRHAVLSSGGKDSLLSYGVLEELGKAPHAIFVNESGRHWYTALNAYRRLAARRSGVHRVWTNSDRFFSWMLRQLPFVRADFARRRSDEYPIRLWTVAVFLFGALPLMRKHGIGRLVIGDEFDTTVRRTHEGITHHAGLYDQSRPFDNAMTRYFVAKGWDVRQFSILRPLSELLIEKTLVERYPELLSDQLSCHAASLRDGRAFPCGKCEKCRRIVGMLCALGADPRQCGYTGEQIASCLEALASTGVHQEREGSEHLAHLLLESGRIPDTSRSFPAREHPEILRLRFHPQASPFDTVPRDLREGVYRLLLEHADGAVQRQGGRWIACDPLAPRNLDPPYPYPKAKRVAKHPQKPAGLQAAPTFMVGEMTWPDAEALFKLSDIAMLPVGAVEQHGPHLPLDTDTYDADYLARRVAAACRPPHPLVLPVIPYGVSYHHEDFPGTFSINPETLSRMVYEIGMSAARNGITKLIVINGHGGNGPALHLAAQLIDRDARIFTCVDSGETSDPDIYDLLDAPNDVHAGEIETSTTLSARPELVKMDLAPRMVPRFSSRYLDFTSKRSVGWYARTAKISTSGVLGDATKATREKGERIWALMTKHLVELVQDLQGLSLDEIYQKRY